MSTIIAFVSQKGGVGKSTPWRGRLPRGRRRRTKSQDRRSRYPAGHIGRLAPDPARRPDRARRSPWKPSQPPIRALKEAAQYDLLIIDGPARTSKGTLAIAKVAHLVVQPTGSSRDDLRPAVREFHALVQEGIPKENWLLRSTASARRRKRGRRGLMSPRQAMPRSPAAFPNGRPTARPRTPAMPSPKPAMPASMPRPMLSFRLSSTRWRNMADLTKLKRRSSLGEPPPLAEASAKSRSRGNGAAARTPPPVSPARRMTLVSPGEIWGRGGGRAP